MIYQELPDLIEAVRACNPAIERFDCSCFDGIYITGDVSPEYLADETPGWEGILQHGVYHTAKNLGVDESVMWGEFFFVEALTKIVRGS